MWCSWMYSTHFKANKTFQYQESACDHFLAGAKRLKCFIFDHVKVFQMVIDTGWEILYVMWYSWMLSTHFKTYKRFQYQEGLRSFSGRRKTTPMCHILALKRIAADKRDWICSYLPHIAHMNVIVSVWTLIYLMW